MRGSPLLQAFMLAFAIMLAGIPVWSLTRPRNHEEPARAQTREPSAMPGDLIVTSTSEAEVELSLSGSTIWRGQPAGVRFETTLSLPPEAELVASVRWKRSGTNAARFEISHDGENRADITIWGDTEATDVLPVSLANPHPKKP